MKNVAAWGQLHTIVGLFIMNVSELIEELQRVKEEYGNLDVGAEVVGYNTGTSECLDPLGVDVYVKKIDYINIHGCQHARGKYYVMISGENE